MAVEDWQHAVLEAIGDPSTRIAVDVADLPGTGSVYSRVMAAIQRGASGKGSPFDRELSKLFDARRLPTLISMSMPMQSPTPLSDDSFIELPRAFHVEVLRGGMNRLLLRALPSSRKTSRVEVLFQYVQHLDIPMRFGGLVIRDVTREESSRRRYLDVLQRFPECRVFCLESGGARVGEVVAAACLVGEEAAAPDAQSMFPMMD